MECGVLSTEQGVWGVEIEVWSDECGVLIVECRHRICHKLYTDQIWGIEIYPKKCYGVFCS